MSMFTEAAAHDRYMQYDVPDDDESVVCGFCGRTGWGERACDCEATLDAMAERPNPTEGK